MKTWIPPVVALAVAGAWVAAKQSAITRVERETEVLRERIVRAARDGVGGEKSERSLSDQIHRDKEESGDIDWKALAESMAEARTGGVPDMRAMMKLQQRIMVMDGPELEAALAEIASLEVGDEVRESLEGMLIGILAQKEPKLVLDRYFERLDDRNGGRSWQLAHAFQQWLGKEPEAAEAWFDQRLAAGDFTSRSLDGKSRSRLQFEAAMVSALLESDPTAAGARVEGLPEDQRADLFEQGMFMNLKPGTERAFAELVRQHLPADRQGTALAQATTVMVHEGGYEQVSGFLDEIDATPEERKSVATQAARDKLQAGQNQGGIDREAVDEMREWLATETPSAADEVTGKALGSVWSGNLEDHVRLVEELHAEGGGDALLVGFLDGPRGMEQPEAARRLAERIVDETQRAEMIRRIDARSGGPVPGTPGSVVTPAE